MRANISTERHLPRSCKAACKTLFRSLMDQVQDDATGTVSLLLMCLPKLIWPGPREWGTTVPQGGQRAKWIHTRLQIATAGDWCQLLDIWKQTLMGMGRCSPPLPHSNVCSRLIFSSSQLPACVSSRHKNLPCCFRAMSCSKAARSVGGTPQASPSAGTPPTPGGRPARGPLWSWARPGRLTIGRRWIPSLMAT